MVMHIKNVLNVPGTKKDFDTCVPAERLEQIAGLTFHSPVAVQGCVENRAGVVTLTMHIAFSLLVTCDRCLKEMVRDFSYDEEHLVVRALENEDREDHYIVANGESIDIAEIAVSDLLLRLPSKMLCREDCKGLCPVCGCDRNVTDCGCEG